MKGTPINSYAPDFELPGTDDQVHHLARYLEEFQGVGVVFLGNQCPHAVAYVDRLKQLQTDFANQGIIVIGINPNDAVQSPEDNFDKMKEFAAQHQLNFPYIRDVTQDVAHSFGVEKTPEAFLLDHEGKLRYRGAIDDQPQDPNAVKVSYLRNAIQQLLAGETIDPTVTDTIGCAVYWRATH